MHTAPYTQSAKPAAFTHNRRRRPKRSSLVDKAIELQTSCSTMAAVEFLKSHQFPSQIIIRVLFDREERRVAGSASAEHA